MQRSYPTVAALDLIWYATFAGGLAVVGCDTQLDIDSSPAVSETMTADADGHLRRNPVRPQLTEEELDHIPYADRFLFDLEKVCDPNRPIVIASRGCPYNCTYCCNRALLRVHPRNPFAARRNR